jgi:hypothetical protein
MVQVCRFYILVILQLILLLVPLHYAIFYMCPPLLNIFCLFINSLVIIMYFFEFHPWHFSIKDCMTRRSLLVRRCEVGLYPLKPLDVDVLKQAIMSQSTSHAQWHASTQVVRSILCLNNIYCSKESVLSVCNACQLAKSHQLPYNNSVHRSEFPLELVFSDVWGPAPTSVGGYKYYISFIDDFSKFSWLYLMHDHLKLTYILAVPNPCSTPFRY